MKKFLLFTVAVFIAATAMAQLNQGFRKNVLTSKVNHRKSMEMVTKKVSQGTMADMSFLKNARTKMATMKASRRAGDFANAILGVSESVYIYSPFTLYMPYNMFSGFAYYATETNVYLALPYMDFMEGEYVTDKVNQFAELGADSVRFKLGTVAGEDGEGKKYVYAGATLSATQTSAFATRNDNEYLGGYYFKENNELYIPANTLSDFLSVFEENATETDYYVLGDMDVLPQELVDAYTSKATWEANGISSDAQGNMVKIPLSGEAKVYMSAYGFYVQGMYSQTGLFQYEPWVFVEASDDGTQGIINADQYLSEGEFYTDETRTTTAYVEFATVSVNSDFSAWAEDYAKVFFIVDDEETQTTTLMDDGMTTVSVYGYSDNDDYAGSWLHMTDMNVTILYEPISGIKDVKSVKEAGNGAWYTINGQRVAQPTQKGLYIHNGKKVVVK